MIKRATVAWPTPTLTAIRGIPSLTASIWLGSKPAWTSQRRVRSSVSMLANW